MYFRDPQLGIPGNAGLKDQLMALRWVKQNIIHFNGNPFNITVFGHSAGGASTHLLMATKETNKLFQRAIIMSGTALNDWAIMPSTNYPHLMALATGYKGPLRDKEILEHLLTISGDTLMTQKVITNDDRINGVILIWGPVVESYKTDNSIVTESVEEMLKTSWSNNIPILIGGSTEEALLDVKSIRKSQDILTLIETDPKYAIPYSIRCKLTEDEIEKACDKMICLFHNKTSHFPNVQSFIDVSIQFTIITNF